MLNTYCKSFDNNNFADTIELNQSLIIYAISSTRKNLKLWKFELGTYFNFPDLFFRTFIFYYCFYRSFQWRDPHGSTMEIHDDFQTCLGYHNSSFLGKLGILHPAYWNAHIYERCFGIQIRSSRISCCIPIPVDGWHSSICWNFR